MIKKDYIITWLSTSKPTRVNLATYFHSSLAKMEENMNIPRQEPWFLYKSWENPLLTALLCVSFSNMPYLSLSLEIKKYLKLIKLIPRNERKSYLYESEKCNLALASSTRYGELPCYTTLHHRMAATYPYAAALTRFGESAFKVHELLEFSCFVFFVDLMWRVGLAVNSLLAS